MELTERIQRAVGDGHLQLITSGKTEKIRYVAVNAAEQCSDPEEKVRAAYYAEWIYQYGYAADDTLDLSRKRRAAPSFLDPHGGRAGRSPALGALSRKR
ncbi:hypothetical protein, partial [Thiomonas sp. FB-6]|uniref:hypothetical protein n=1 Tax=Thiomonas sp. FB-6 TaxID=1158291 RepID=UPI00056EAF13